MKHTEYNSKKKALIEFAKQFKKTDDKPLACEAINNFTDSLLKELSNEVSTKRYNMYSNWLSNVASNKQPN